MAKRFSRKHGKSGSNVVKDKTQPSWIKYKPKEIEALILKLHKAGNSSSKIGIILRDSYGIPDVKIVSGKKITEILKENKVSFKLPEDLTNLIKRHISLTKHFESNHHDMSAKKGLQFVESKIKRLTKYYIKKGILPKGWRFEKKKAKLLVE